MTPSQQTAPGGLQAEIAGFRRLLDLLVAEGEALRKGDVEAVANVAAEKQREVLNLSEMARLRGAPPASARTASREWGDLMAIAAQASQRNAENGEMILARQRFVDRALAVLHEAAGRSATYGANGMAQFEPGSSRRIASI